VKAVHRYLNPGEPYSMDEPDPNVTNWVAKAGAKVIGFVQCVCHSEAHAAWTGCWLFSLIVWRRYRGLGIGEALTMRVIEHARAQGSPQLFIAVYDDNIGALEMYRKLGFEHTTLPALEPGLAAEAQQFGRRRIIMCRRLSVC
jgi:ribosomal protein S18 acetylase RimI-like enzyme